MPPKRQSVDINTKGGTLYINGRTVRTVYDTQYNAWFRSNDVADALGYSNASSSVAQKISPKDKLSFKDICLHKNSSLVESHGQNVFINQRGLEVFLMALDSTCDVQKIRNICQSPNPSAGRCKSSMRSFTDKMDGTVSRNTVAVGRTSSTKHDRGNITIGVENNTLMVNEVFIATIYDIRRCAWFKGIDVAEALGYANPSSSVLQKIPSDNKAAFSEIPLHRESPQVPVHPKNVFINQSGLESFLLDLYPSCDIHTIQSIGVSMKNDEVPARSKFISNDSQKDCDVTSGKLKNPDTRLFINGHPVSIIVDVKKLAWFKVIDVATALGLKNSSSLITPLVSEMDKKSFKDIATHVDSPDLEADPRNIFINQTGLIDVLLTKSRQSQGSEFSTGFSQTSPTHFTAGDKLVLQVINSCFKELRTLSLNLVLNYPKFCINDLSKMSTSLPDSSARCLPFNSPNSHEYDNSGYWDEGFIMIKNDPNTPGQSSIIVQSTNNVPHSETNYTIKVHSPKRLFTLVKDLLSPLCLGQGSQCYGLPTKELARVVYRICNNFEKTLENTYKLTLRVNGSIPTLNAPQPLSDDQIASLTSRNSTGEWIYVASSKPYAQKSVFKVGSTEDRLAKRLTNYQTGRLSEDRYYFFKVFPVHNCKKVDKLIGYFLRPWAEIHEKVTELYKLDFQALSSSVSYIVNFYEDSYQCVSSLMAEMKRIRY